MALIEDGLKGLGPSLLVGIGAVLAAPIVIPAVMGGLRPLAKTAIKGYLYLSDSLKESLAEAGEQLSDMVAEVRSEAQNGTTAHAEAGTEHHARTEEGHTETEGRKARRRES